MEYCIDITWCKHCIWATGEADKWLAEYVNCLHFSSSLLERPFYRSFGATIFPATLGATKPMKLAAQLVMPRRAPA